MATTQLTETSAETAHVEETGPIGALGLDWGIFLAQLVNFAIVLIVLKKFVFGPVVKRLEERTNKIDAGLKNAQDAQKRLAEIDALKEDTMTEAKKQSAAVLAEAKKDAEALRVQMIAKTKEEVGAVVAKGKEQLAAERESSIRELRGAVADLAVAAARKVLESEIDEKRAKALAEAAVKEALK
jgi:F-type H+-transporting ATPase subunit b